MPARDFPREAAALNRIAHHEAMELAAEENRRFRTILEQLRSEDWQKATDCSRWTVRDIALHVTASAEAQASPVEFLRQAWQGRRLTADIGGRHWVDGLNEAQLRTRIGLSGQDLPARWHSAADAALKARKRMPAIVRALPLLPFGTVDGIDFGWQPLGYLFDVGFMSAMVEK
ncbi:maleylpyruvate isomerase N-terminal domain-containing protein [Arthrobacter globiformis]|uniref:maleylpyruvate isomerase N-terminal domain-containing protein n=1 Tax=Arthrobacter globiformis TaxID=1665 RepID=UPI00277F94D2|nr:maleylpyruvate isomerase N-terminal domain-containing protein [Arthrobacter globiformis]MDQ0864777.1 uncharacterized protein (TIGR03083 family) [Arthrobacter globiformis]